MKPRIDTFDMGVSFSVNQHDQDGDVFDHCILIHIGDHQIIRFDNTNELQRFVEKLDDIIIEIRTGVPKNYHP